MAYITLRVLDGADRGRVFAELPTPVTIGREEGNTVQLNDERVSRFHLKLQEDQNRVVLTDLQSTNGTKVNGEDVQLRILRFGDVIFVGRSLLLYGSRQQIAWRLAQLRKGDVRGTGMFDPEADSADVEESDLDFELQWNNNPDVQATLHALLPPDLPERLSPGQSAQLSELVSFVHIKLRELIATVRNEAPGKRVNLDDRQWQKLLDLQGMMAKYLREIGDPPEE